MQLNKADLRFITALSAQVAGAIYNVRLLDEARRRALQLQTAAEIARDISSLLDLDELLAKAVTLVRDRFSFYHAAIFLVDPGGEYAVVREATGKAGAEMKRAGHKLGVGSKSRERNPVSRRNRVSGQRLEMIQSARECPPHRI